MTRAEAVCEALKLMRQAARKLNLADQALSETREFDEFRRAKMEHEAAVNRLAQAEAEYEGSKHPSVAPTSSSN